ncbi:hypothetical protein PYCC9005_002699 [Savitreella phatthalungensis]
MVQTPAQRQANAKFAAAQSARRGKSEADRAALSPVTGKEPNSDEEVDDNLRRAARRRRVAGGAAGKGEDKNAGATIRKSSTQKFVIGLIALLIFGSFTFELLRLFFA